jgi:hypothetical protein
MLVHFTWQFLIQCLQIRNMDHLTSSQDFPFFISYLIYYTTVSTAHVCQTLSHNSEVFTERGEDGRMNLGIVRD